MNEQLKISPWDASEFLESQDDIDAYLEAAFETGDPRQITKALGTVAKAQGLMNIANKTGLAGEHLHTNFGEDGNPTLLTLTTVIDSLGYQLSLVPKKHEQHTILSSQDS